MKKNKIEIVKILPDTPVEEMIIEEALAKLKNEPVPHRLCLRVLYDEYEVDE